MSVKRNISNKPIYSIHLLIPRIGDKPIEYHYNNLTYELYRKIINVILKYHPAGMVNYSAFSLRVTMYIGIYDEMIKEIDDLYNLKFEKGNRGKT